MFGSGIFLVLLLFVAALQSAYDLGVKHTEERWSDAAAKVARQEEEVFQRGFQRGLAEGSRAR